MNNISIIQILLYILIFIIGFIFAKIINRETEKKSKLFNECVQEIVENGNSKSEAVRYCNGGN